MKNTTLHKQCTLTRKGHTSTTTCKWLPSNLAKVGRTVEFKDSDGNWIGDEWVVLKAGLLLEKLHQQWGSLDMPRRRGK